MNDNGINENCAILERRALSGHLSAQREWDRHAETCPECAFRQILMKIIFAQINQIEFSLDDRHMSILKKALYECKKKVDL